MKEVINKKELISENFNFLLDKLSNCENIPNNKSELSEKQQLLTDIKTFDEDDDINFSKKISIDQMIENLSNIQNIINENNHKGFQTLTENMHDDIHSNNGPEDVLKDMIYITEENKKFQEYMKERKMRQIEDMINYPLTEACEEDENDPIIMCNICGQEEFSETGIIFCACCKFAMHFVCYGLNQKQEESWLCDACKLYGENYTRLECLLCPVKEGLLKQCDIKTNSGFFKEIMAIRTEDIESTSNSNIIIEIENSSDSQSGRSRRRSKNDATGYAWVHLSCSLWNNAVKIKNNDNFSGITLTDNIFKQNFEEFCYVCKRKNCGVTVKCHHTNCEMRFHVECARKVKFSLEVDYSIKNDVKYYILCHKHLELDINKQLKIRKQILKNEINSYSGTLYKINKQYKRVYNTSLLQPLKPKINKIVKVNLEELNDLELKSEVNLSEKNEEQENKMKPRLRFVYNKNNKKKFIQNLRKVLYVMTNPNILLSKNAHEYSVEEGFLIKVQYNEILNNKNFPWELVNDKLTWEENNFVFKSLFPLEKRYNWQILKMDKSELVKLYCYCQAPLRKKERMVSCIGKDCKYGMFHKRCIDEIHIPWSELDAKEYKCKECIEEDDI
jgi:hypothetical protein